MKKSSVILFVIFFHLIFFQSFSQNKNIDLVKKYVKYYNTGDYVGTDTILSDKCKSFSKNIILDKIELIDIVKNLSKNEKIEIKEITSTQNTVRTKEILTDDIINYLKLDPIIRKREYNIDHNYKIKSIFNLDVSFPENFEVKQDKFLDWASITYPELYDDMTEKYTRGENIAEERRFLLTLLKEEGIEVLDSFGIDHMDDVIDIEIYDKEDNIVRYSESSITFDDFRLNCLLKTKDQIEIIFGSPCEIKSISGSIFWYYGSNHCNESYTGPKIYYKDNGEDVQQVQIQFNDSHIAVSVNAI